MAVAPPIALRGAADLEQRCSVSSVWDWMSICIQKLAKLWNFGIQEHILEDRTAM
jgi:hypothetical protein